MKVFEIIVDYSIYEVIIRFGNWKVGYFIIIFFIAYQLGNKILYNDRKYEDISNGKIKIPSQYIPKSRKIKKITSNIHFQQFIAVFQPNDMLKKDKFFLKSKFFC